MQKWMLFFVDEVGKVCPLLGSPPMMGGFDGEALPSEVWALWSGFIYQKNIFH